MLVLEIIFDFDLLLLSFQAKSAVAHSDPFTSCLFLFRRNRLNGFLVQISFELSIVEYVQSSDSESNWPDRKGAPQVAQASMPASSGGIPVG